MLIKKSRKVARTMLTALLNFFMWSTLFRWILYMIIRITKWLPDDGFKARVCNWTESLSWQGFNFSGVQIEIGKVTVKMVPHHNEFDFAAILYQKLNYEFEVYNFLDKLENYGCVIDIGANIGVFSLYMAQRFPNAHIYAFEPGREAFSRLLMNIKINPSLASRINPFFSAVGPETPTITFYTPEDHITNSSLDAEFAQQFGTVKAVIAQVAPKILFQELLQSPQPHLSRALVKIDAEGAEAVVLQQLRELIVAAQADLLIEILPIYANSLREHFEYFRAAGYFAYILQSGGPLLMTELQASSDWRDWWLSKTAVV